MAPQHSLRSIRCSLSEPVMRARNDRARSCTKLGRGTGQASTQVCSWAMPTLKTDGGLEGDNVPKVSHAGLQL